ncbi:PWI domain-containing protein [Gigaspora margarita]|uniref:PWI domain-containing protein n=1 Tax=Gigaspora margarita TaxID=4874 RepID=A0A8H4EIJ3_GIGMA|nr:PWI domain-containing protein [Gigaspora margarita]
MGDGGFFKGTSLEQDSRFSDKQKKLLKSMNFPAEFNRKVDLKRVNMTVIKPWIAQKIVDLLGGEDEVVVNYVFGLLEETDLDPRMMQINLTGFLERNAPIFVTELWKLLLSAQDCESGIPAIFLEQKMEEIRKRKEDDERIMAEIRRRREREDEERAKFREIREKERKEEREKRDRDQKSARRRSRSRNSHRIRSRSRSRSVENKHQRRSHRRSRSAESRHQRRSHRRSRSKSRDRVTRERSGERRKHKSHRRGSRSRSKEKRRYEERRSRRSRSREEEDTSKRRRLSKEEVVTKASSEKYSSTPSPRRNYHDQHTGYVVTEDEARKRLDDSVEETDSVQNSPPRKKVVDAPIFKSKWNDDEDEEEIKKTSMSGLEQLEQLRAKAFESMKARK